jgi:hypothetical protein
LGRVGIRRGRGIDQKRGEKRRGIDEKRIVKEDERVRREKEEKIEERKNSIV